MYKLHLLNIVIACIIILQPSLTNNENTEKCEYSIDLEIIEQFSNKSVLTKDGDIYNKSQYYSYNNIYKGCVCQIKTCIWKCCPQGHKYEYTEDVCVSTNGKDFTPKSPFDKSNNAILLFDKLGVNYTAPIDLGDDIELTLLENGSIYLLESELLVDQYCIDNNENSSLYVWLPPDETFEEDRFYMLIEASVLLLSVPFLLATFLVYSIIPELRNLQGKTFMCYLFNLMWGYIFLATSKLVSGDKSAICIFCGYMIQFCFLVSFFWLNVMCFDIWRTFSGLRGKTPKEEIKKFLLYCLYAWGCPLIIVIVTVVMQFSDIPDHLISPNIGLFSCFFYEHQAIIAYFYGPMSVVVFCNVVLFSVTAYKIKNIRRETSHSLKRSGSQKHNQNEKQRFNLYLKLFLIMGVNWLLEIISYFLKNCQRCTWVFKLSDYMNMLQGVLIFIIFVCKKNVWRLLKKRYNRLRHKEELQYTTTFKTQVSTFSSSTEGTKV